MPQLAKEIMPDVASAGTGVLACQHIETAIQSGVIKASAPITPEQIQPASLDLRLGPVAYRVRAAFMPGTGNSVQSRIDELKLHEVDLSSEGVLERGAVYIIPLMESVDLPEGISAVASPKSTTGRLDVFTRLLTDGTTRFDQVGSGYTGGLYLEVAPQTFGIIAHQGDRLNQLRFRQGTNTIIDDKKLFEIHKDTPLICCDTRSNADVQNGLWLSVDLKGNDEESIMAWRAKRHAPLIDLQKIGHYDIHEFWEPIPHNRQAKVILNPEDFYIMVSRERVVVPPDYSAEMIAYDHTAGELRVHYAGFFDPGFGCHEVDGKKHGTAGVLEVRSHDVPFVLEHGQPICRLVYENMAAAPARLYGQDIASNYAKQQGPKLSKHFKMVTS